MATVYGTNRTSLYREAAAETGPPTNIQAYDDGRARWIWDTIEAAGEAAGSTYYMGRKVPKGARVIDCWMATDDIGGTAATADLKVGSNVLLDDIDVEGAATFTRMTMVSNVSPSFVTTAESDITVVSATEALTGTIDIAVCYVID